MPAEIYPWSNEEAVGGGGAVGGKLVKPEITLDCVRQRDIHVYSLAHPWRARLPAAAARLRGVSAYTRPRRGFSVCPAPVHPLRCACGFCAILEMRRKNGRAASSLRLPLHHVHRLPPPVASTSPSLRLHFPLPSPPLPPPVASISPSRRLHFPLPSPPLPPPVASTSPSRRLHFPLPSPPLPPPFASTSPSRRLHFPLPSPPLPPPVASTSPSPCYPCHSPFPSAPFARTAQFVQFFVRSVPDAQVKTYKYIFNSLLTNIVRMIVDRKQGAVSLFELHYYMQSHPGIDVFARLSSISDTMSLYLQMGILRVREHVACGDTLDTLAASMLEAGTAASLPEAGASALGGMRWLSRAVLAMPMAEEQHLPLRGLRPNVVQRGAGDGGSYGSYGSSAAGAAAYEMS
ncbi:unnamed protein product [Closterium sp. NIES-64]|nr:unnamed protein product [Closterium sp. NIES-64]CAI6005887.1 unnamed protein product [Closterium sp. NIES-65]